MLVALHVILYAAVAVALSWVSGILVRTRIQRLRRPASCQPLQKRYPHVEPILGLDLSYQIWREFHNGEFCEGMRRRHEKHGDTFLAKDLGADIIYTIDPDNIRTITTHNFQDYRKAAWTEEACKHVGRGVLMTDGDEWRRSRTMLRPIFARSAMDDPALLEPHVQNMLHAICGDEDVDGQVDFQPICRRFTLDVVTDFLFGSSTLSLNPDPDDTGQGRHLLSLFDKFDPPAGTFIAIGLLAWIELLPSYRRISAVVSGMKAFFRSHMNQILSGLRQSSASAGTSCFRSMKDSGMLDEVILGELQNVFFASFDTTTALLADIVGVIARRQDILTRMRQEIEQLGEKRPDKADLKDLPYLHSVILEGLRLYTPVSSHSRRARRDTILPHGGGIDGKAPIYVREGTTVVWSVYSLNRSPTHYGADWAEFRPERWTKLLGSGANMHLLSFFMPFGSGPRICMGQQMALTEISYALIRLMQEFPVIESRDTRPFREAKAVSYYSAYGTLVSMR